MTSYEKKAKNRDINCEWSITMIPNDDDEVSLSSCSKPLFHVMVNPRADDEKLIGLTSVSQVKVNSAKKIMGHSSSALRFSKSALFLLRYTLAKRYKSYA